MPAFSFVPALIATCYCLSSLVLSTPSTHTGCKILKAKALHRASGTRPAVHLSLQELSWVSAMRQVLLLAPGIQ